MTEDHPELIDDSVRVTLAELCRACNVEVAFVEELVAEGILEPSGARGAHWSFPGTSVKRTRLSLRLRRDLGVNLAGAALALQLLEQIDVLHARMGVLKRDSQR